MNSDRVNAEVRSIDTVFVCGSVAKFSGWVRRPSVGLVGLQVASQRLLPGLGACAGCMPAYMIVILMPIDK